MVLISYFIHNNNRGHASSLRTYMPPIIVYGQLGPAMATIKRSMLEPGGREEGG